MFVMQLDRIKWNPIDFGEVGYKELFKSSLDSLIKANLHSLFIVLVGSA